jgi:hypothetical protein
MGGTYSTHGAMRNAYKIILGNSEDVISKTWALYRGIIQKWILKEYAMGIWTACNYFSIASNDGLL